MMEQGKAASTLTAKLLSALRARRAMVATAESCTGGLLAGAITSVAGSSDVFARGWVTYSNQAKQEELGVSAADLERVGAVSREVVEAMADGARRRAGAEWGVATSGIAGPDGGTPDKPVGTVWIGWAGPDGLSSHCFHFTGDRHAVREQTVVAALQGLLARIDE